MNKTDLTTVQTDHQQKQIISAYTKYVAKTLGVKRVSQADAIIYAIRNDVAAEWQSILTKLAKIVNKTKE